MNRSKGVKQIQARFLKYNEWIDLFALMVSFKYTGHFASLKNVSDFVKSGQANEENSPFPKATDAITATRQVKGPRISMAKKLFSL